MYGEKLKQKIPSLSSKEDLKQNWAVLAVPAVFLLALYLRYLPEQGMQYLQALDPYWIFRQSQHLALDGSPVTVDFMRFFPYNAPFYTFNVGDIVIPSALYWLGPFAIFGSYLEWAQFYPALMGALGVLATYFLGKELFDRLTGVSAAFFLATIPGVLQRTSAGFFEKEPVGSLFMILSLYFFTRAWKRKEHWAGLVSGVALGMFTISWGGSKMLWLLYPLVVGLMMWINEDIEELIVAYTPTILVGAALASIFNPARFWITGKFFLVNMGLLLFLWSRYLVEEFEIMDKDSLKYYVPSVSFMGLIALVLSPLYSDFIARKFISLISTVNQASGGSVIGGTVAENQAISLGQLAGQLGALSASRIGFILEIPGSSAIASFLGLLGNLNGAWPLAFAGVVLLGTKISAMALRKSGVIGESLEEIHYYKILAVVALIWTGAFSAIFQSSVIMAVAPPLIGIAGGIGILYGLEEFKELNISYEWIHILPLAWIVTNVLAAVARSRLIFLAAFPVALFAGYTFSKVLKRLKEINISSPEEVFDGHKLKLGLIGVLVILTVSVNFSAGFVTSNSLGGSPNQLWMDNLDYMEQNTPEGSVMLSWWDYGYWFQSIGERSTVADGGNVGYYTGNSSRVNFPIADFLTSENPGNYTDMLEKHSVDYIVLDETMIGKYSAVSQISNRDNENFKSMLQLETSRDIKDSLSQNKTLLTASSGRVTVYTPVNSSERQLGLVTEGERVPKLELESRGGAVRSEIGCTVTEDGLVENQNVSRPAKLRGFGEVCLAENPYYGLERSLLTSRSPQVRPQSARLILVPREIAKSTLVRLYLMDGYGVEFVEKVEKGSNGFVKMWDVDLEEG